MVIGRPEQECVVTSFERVTLLGDATAADDDVLKPPFQRQHDRSPLLEGDPWQVHWKPSYPKWGARLNVAWRRQRGKTPAGEEDRIRVGLAPFPIANLPKLWAASPSECCTLALTYWEWFWPGVKVSA
jgi:hypothetical protein